MGAAATTFFFCQFAKGDSGSRTFDECPFPVRRNSCDHTRLLELVNALRGPLHRVTDFNSAFTKLLGVRPSGISGGLSPCGLSRCRAGFLWPRLPRRRLEGEVPAALQSRQCSNSNAVGLEAGTIEFVSRRALGNADTAPGTDALSRSREGGAEATRPMSFILVALAAVSRFLIGCNFFSLTRGRSHRSRCPYWVHLRQSHRPPRRALDGDETT